MKITVDDFLVEGTEQEIVNLLLRLRNGARTTAMARGVMVGPGGAGQGGQATSHGYGGGYPSVPMPLAAQQLGSTYSVSTERDRRIAERQRQREERERLKEERRAVADHKRQQKEQEYDSPYYEVPRFRHSKAMAATYDYVASYANGRTAFQVQEHFGIPAGTAKTRLSRLIAEGLIVGPAHRGGGYKAVKP